MGEIEKTKTLEETGHKENETGDFQWVLMETKDHVCDYDLMESDSEDLDDSSSSLETIEDAASSSSSSNGPLFELSDLMEQLPIKRGLSKFYKGKSESFGSLASVKSIEDLAKKKRKFSVSCRSRRSMKSLEGQSQRLSPKATIGKNKNGSSSTIVRSSIFSSLGKVTSLMAN